MRRNVSMIDHSQNGEQKVIFDYFGGSPGAFLDIGANDGETLSNSRALALSGWSGVCVEPSFRAYVRLSALYENNDSVECVNAAITSVDGPIDFWDSGTHLNKGDVALLSTTVKSELGRWEKSGEQFSKTRVDGVTFKTLCAR